MKENKPGTGYEKRETVDDIAQLRAAEDGKSRDTAITCQACGFFHFTPVLTALCTINTGGFIPSLHSSWNRSCTRKICGAAPDQGGLLAQSKPCLREEATRQNAALLHKAVNVPALFPAQKAVDATHTQKAVPSG